MGAGTIECLSFFVAKQLLTLTMQLYAQWQIRRTKNTADRALATSGLRENYGKGCKVMAIELQIEIDDAELQRDMNALKAACTPEQFNRAMYRVFARTGSTIKRIVKTDVPHEYQVKAGEVGATIRSPKVTTSGMGVGCVIPVVGPRRYIGPEFKAKHGAHGWKVLRRKKRYKVTAKILRGQDSELPTSLGDYGGMAPFRNLGSKIMPNAWHRLSKKRGPIMSMVGIAIPQMPLNRSKDEIQGEIMTTMKTRTAHELQRVLAVK